MNFIVKLNEELTVLQGNLKNKTFGSADQRRVWRKRVKKINSLLGQKKNSNNLKTSAL